VKKICAHIENGYNGPLGPAGAIKLFNPNVQWAGEVRQMLGPKALIIVRYKDADYGSLSDNPVKLAETFFYSHLSDMLAISSAGPAIFEGRCEPAECDLPHIIAYESRRLQLMHAYDLGTGVFSFSVGVPDLLTWSKLTPVLNVMGPRDAVCLHEYWVDTADIQNNWHVCRFSLPEAWAYLHDVPILITECGRDMVEGRGLPGWQRTCSAETFLEDLRRADARYANFPNVHAAAVFQIGSWDSQWAPFDCYSLWHDVAKEVEPYTVPFPFNVPNESAQEQGGTSNMPIDSPPIQLCDWTVKNKRAMTFAEFSSYVDNLPALPQKLDSVWLHHTATPRQVWTYSTVLNVKAYYEGLPWTDEHGQVHIGWTEGPHLFVGDEGIWVFTPLTRDGVGVQGHNTNTRHVEMIGTYDSVKPNGALWENTKHVLKKLLDHYGLGLEGLRFHREVSSKSCPGYAVTMDWVRSEIWPTSSKPLPQNEPDGDLGFLWEKARWWIERLVRARQEGNPDYDPQYALEIEDGLINREYGLLYRIERKAKGL